MKLEMGAKLAAGCLVAGLMTMGFGCKTGSQAPLTPRSVVPSPSLEPAALTAPAVPAPAAVPGATLDLPPPAADKDMGELETGATVGKVPAKSTSTKHDAAKAPAGKAKGYTVAKGDSLSKIASKNGVTVAALASANGMKETDVLAVGKKLTVPAAGTKSVAHKAATASAKKTTKVATTKKTTKAPAAKKADGATPAVDAAAGAAAPAAGGKYAVQNGDNPPKIAKKFHVKVADLLAANGLNEDTAKKLKIGQELVIPGAAAGAAAPAADAAAPGAVPGAGEAAVSPAVRPAAPGEVAVAPVAATSTFGHVVAEGETLASIAESYGITVEDVLKVNPAVKTDADLKPNGTLVIPTK